MKSGQRIAKTAFTEVNMVEKIKNSKAIDIFELVFKVVFLVHVVLAFNALYNITGWLKVTSALTLALGGIVVLFRLACIKDYIKRKDAWIIIAFFLSYVISMLVNRDYGLFANFKCLVWMVLCFVTLYLVKPGKKMESIKFDFAVLGNIYIIMMTIQGVICNYMFFTQYNRRIITDDANKAIGFYLNRLMGLYDDTNQGAVNSAMCIIIAIYLFPRVKNKIAKAWYAFAVVMMGMFIVLSVSRTALIGVTVGVFLYVFFATLIKGDGNNLKKASIYAILCAAGIMALYGPAKRQLANISNKILEIRQENDSADEIIEEDPLLIVEEIEHVSLEREDVNLDISNHRFDIWKWGVKHYLKKPLLGYGKYSFVSYVMDHEPNCMEESNYTANIESAHNMIIDVMVAQGTLGLIIFLAWMGVCLVTLVKYFRFIAREHQGFAALMFSILMLNLVSSLIMPAVLYINSATAYMSWLTLGILMYMMKDAKTNYENATPEERKWKNPVKEIIDKYGVANTLFVTGFVMYMTATLASLTGPLCNTEGMWGIIRKLNSLLRYGSYGVLLLKLVYDAYKNKRQIISLVVSLGCIGWAFLGHMDRTLAFYVLIILAAYGIASETVIKSAVIVQAVITGCTVVLSQLGTIQDSVEEALYKNRVRHYLGFAYITYAPMIFLFIVLGYSFLKKGKLNIAETIIGMIINFYLFKMTDTRSAFLVVSVALVLFFVYGLIQKHRIISKICGWILMIMPWLCAVFSFYIHVNYTNDNDFFVKLNDILSNRLQLGKNAIDTYGIHPFGSDIILKGHEVINTDYWWEYNYVDCDYLRIALVYGWVILAIILVMYTYVIKKYNSIHMYYVGWIIMLLLVLGITEPRLINLTFNPFILLLMSRKKDDIQVLKT